jgi:hypothetical protein
MTLSAAHRPLNPPFRRAPVSNVRRDEVGEGICRGVFGTFCGQKVQSTPRAKTAVNSRPKSGKQHQSQTAIGTFCGQKVHHPPRAETAVVLVPLQAIMRRFKTCFRRRWQDSPRTCEHANIGEHPLFACSRVRPVKNRGLHCNWQLRAAGLASQARPVRLF